jgi:hypothetical protein
MRNEYFWNKETFMSSTTYIEPDPPLPPPPQIIAASGETQISLQQLFGTTVQVQLAQTLEELVGNREVFLRNELGLPADSPQAERLDWKKTGDGPGSVREYTFTLRGQQLPAELHQGQEGQLNIHLLIGTGMLQVRHNYHVIVAGEDATAVQQRARPALERAVARAVNPLLATAVSQALKQRAEQTLRQRLKQEQRLQTRVTAALNYQTTGFVRTTSSYFV